MSKRGPLLLLAVAAIALLGFAGVFVAFLASPVSSSGQHETDLPPTMSRDEFQARYGYEPALPTTAGDVRYAHDRFGFGYLYLIRFDAPTADCLAFGRAVIRQRKGAGSLTPIVSRPDALAPSFLEANNLDRVDWFDPESIASGVEWSEEPPQASIWIDTERGRFFYLRNCPEISVTSLS